MARFRNSRSVDDLHEALRLSDAVRTMAPRNVAVAHTHARFRVAAAHYWQQNDDSVRTEMYLSEAKRTANEMRDAFPDRSATYQVLAQIAAFEGNWDIVLTHTLQANQYAKSLTDAGETPFIAMLLDRMTLLRDHAEIHMRNPQVERVEGYHRVWATAALDGRDKAAEQYEQWESQLDKTAHVDPTAAFVVFNYFGSLRRHKRRQDRTRVIRRKARLLDSAHQGRQNPSYTESIWKLRIPNARNRRMSASARCMCSFSG